jgi:hypothetical protein
MSLGLVDDVVLVGMMLSRLGVPILMMTLMAAVMNRAARSLS